MLKTDFEFYKGILFIRLKGNLTKSNIKKSNINKILNTLKCKSIVFNISKINSIDAYAINYLINYNNYIKSKQGQVFLCHDTLNFVNKFSTKIKIIRKEKEVL